MINEESDFGPYFEKYPNKISLTITHEKFLECAEKPEITTCNVAPTHDNVYCANCVVATAAVEQTDFEFSHLYYNLGRLYYVLFGKPDEEGRLRKFPHALIYKCHEYNIDPRFVPDRERKQDYRESDANYLVGAFDDYVKDDKTKYSTLKFPIKLTLEKSSY